MWKYKSQTLISTIGLAVGFTCFALATFWIRYEMTYDNFHKDAEQMYVIYVPGFSSPTEYHRGSPNPLAAYLKETFPEIENAITLAPSSPDHKITVEGMEIPILEIMADSSFFQMFNVKILEGSPDFLIPGSKKIAITQKKARQLFGNEHPIGKILKNGWGEDVTICAVVSEMSKRSNYAFDLISPFPEVPPDQIWYTSYGDNIIKLFSGTNIEDFEKKLHEHKTANFRNLTIKPLTKIRYTDPNVTRDIKFQYIFIFAICGLLVVLCSLFNYLTLFISRFRIRQKELALRMVCGASGGSILAMLSVEFILTLFFAIVLGGMLTQLFHEPFLAFSGIHMNLSAIYLRSLLYVVGVILISLLLFWLTLIIFKRRNLNVSIRQNNKKLFRKSSVVIQLMISVIFSFCTLIILKQMYFLHHSDEMGFSFQNRGAIMLRGGGQVDVFANQLKQIPEITEVVNAEGMINLLPLRINLGLSVDDWDDKPIDAKRINIKMMYISPEYTNFYDFRLLAGEMLTDSDPDSLVLINESAYKAFGWHDAVGKNFDNGFYTVKGVIRNIYHSAPTIEATPTFFTKRSPREKRVSGSSAPVILFKYREGSWETCQGKINQLIENEYANSINLTIIDYKEEYNKFLRSENALIKLLSIVSMVCVLICVFGFVSLVSLTCEERRKSIAIRKINGATIGDILHIFTKEYFSLLIVGAALAFPAAFFIMQRWLEQYVKQTNIAAWVYLSILFALALVIVLCVGWQVYKTSIENPAEVVKQDN